MNYADVLMFELIIGFSAWPGWLNFCPQAVPLWTIVVVFGVGSSCNDEEFGGIVSAVAQVQGIDS